MEDLYEEGAVLNDDFEFIDTIDNEGKLAHVELKGERTLTRGGALIRVHKHMEVRFVGGVPEVRTTWYQYQSWRPGRRRDDELQLLRYDQAHEGFDMAHVHKYGPDGSQIEHYQMALDEIPRLDGFIREVAALADAYSYG